MLLQVPERAPEVRGDTLATGTPRLHGVRAEGLLVAAEGNSKGAHRVAGALHPVSEFFGGHDAFHANSRIVCPLPRSCILRTYQHSENAEAGILSA